MKMQIGSPAITVGLNPDCRHDDDGWDLPNTSQIKRRHKQSGWDLTQHLNDEEEAEEKKKKKEKKKNEHEDED